MGYYEWSMPCSKAFFFVRFVAHIVLINFFCIGYSILMLFLGNARKVVKLGLVSIAVLQLAACESFDRAMVDAGIFAPTSLGLDAMAVHPQPQDNLQPKIESVRFMPLGQGVLIPDVVTTQNLPRDDIGPYELRGESLAGALQFILSEFDIPLAVETNLAGQRKVTIANLQGRLDLMVEQLCEMSDLYCVYKNDVLTVQNEHDYAVTIPPSGANVDIIHDVAKSIAKVIGEEPIVDMSTRTLLYKSTRKQAASLAHYFAKLRSNMALINYEVGIWNVRLGRHSQFGVQWDSLLQGAEGRAQKVAGLYAGEYGAPISIGLPGDLGDAYGMYDISKFLSEFGDVQVLSKPTISVMSGANGLWNVKADNAAEGTKPEEIKIGLSSLWDGSSVFSDLDLRLAGVVEKEIRTQMRIRPGDSLLLAGMMRNVGDAEHPENEELVIMLRPKVVVYKARKDYYGINGVPRADDAREEQTNIWQSIGDEPMILVPEGAPWPPMPSK